MLAKLKQMFNVEPADVAYATKGNTKLTGAIKALEFYQSQPQSSVMQSIIEKQKKIIEKNYILYFGEAALSAAKRGKTTSLPKLEDYQ
jgi:hypothetical protein